jgi:prolipoprotein diacylglyceryltransferase
MIFFGVSVVCSIINLMNFSPSAMFNLVYNVYAFVIIYSIWRKIQENNEEPKPQQIAMTIEQNVA